MSDFYRDAVKLKEKYGWDTKEWARRTGVRQDILSIIESGNAAESKDLLDVLVSNTKAGRFKNTKEFLRFNTPVVIGVCIHKGGSGKTTCAVNIADILADRGYNVLLIDSDSQSDATVNLLDHDDPEIIEAKKQKNFFNSIASGRDIRSQILRTRFDRLDIVPSSTRMASAEVMLTAQTNSGVEATSVFKNCMEGLIHDNYYDFVIVDMDKQIGTLNETILNGCTHLLIVSECAKFHVAGVSVMLAKHRAITQINKSNPSLEILGIILNKVVNRKSIIKETTDTFDSEIPGLRFNNLIRSDANVERAQWNANTLREYNRRCNAWKDLNAVIDELLSRLESRSV